MTDLVDLGALSDACRLPYKQRRIALRGLVQPVLEQMFSKPDVEQLIRTSPIIGTGDKQVSIRPQISGLRDQFDLPTLTAIAVVGTSLAQTHANDGGLAGDLVGRGDLRQAITNALIFPGLHGFPSSASRTGYAFGRPDWLTDSAHEANVAAIWAAAGPSMTPAITVSTPTPKPEDFPPMPEPRPDHAFRYTLPEGITLDRLILMGDHVRILSGCTDSMAFDVLASLMTKGTDYDRFSAAAECSELRVGKPTLPTGLLALRKDEFPIVKAAVEHISMGAPTKPTVSITEAAATVTKGLHRPLPKDLTEEDLTAGLASFIPTKESTTMTATSSLPKIDPTIASMIDGMLTSVKLPTLSGLMTSITDLEGRVLVQNGTNVRLLKDKADLERQLKEAVDRPAAMPVAVSASSDGTIPSGTYKMVPAWEAFGLTKGKDAFSFKVPVWTWDGVHPHVPAVNPDYVFRPFELMRVLYALVGNKRAYLHGHTGTGKTTLLEQIAAVLRYPFMRLNFDSEISRMDLIGRDTLTSEGGTTISQFVEGILPQMMQSPCIGCFDELDFVRPDVAYVMQRMLEGDSLVLTEDGGRVVKPHAMFRAFATGNTVGQGDEYGMYQGARVQSTALLDRFAVWQKIDYLKPEDRDDLIRAKAPGLPDDLRTKLNRYITEHLTAFTTSKVLQPLSPRGFLGLADALVFFIDVIPTRKDAVQQALEATILDRCSVQDRVVLSGLASRVFG